MKKTSVLVLGVRKRRSDKAFHVEVLGVSLLSPASKKERTWEDGPGAPCKLLLSRSFSERCKGKGVSEKAFHLEVP